MSDMTHSHSAPGVALLFEDAGLSAHLRQALLEAGARIVHEGPATRVTREELADNGAEVVVVNLDARVEEHLDTLYDIFDESRQRIVFNDAEVSSGLSGWDQARWARHLAAKLMDQHDTDPPRPAEARPIEAHPTEWLLPENEMPEAPPDESESDSGDTDRDDVDSTIEQSEKLTAEIEALLAEDDDLLAKTSFGADPKLSIKLDIAGIDEFGSGNATGTSDTDISTEDGAEPAAPSESMHGDGEIDEPASSLPGNGDGDGNDGGVFESGEIGEAAERDVAETGTGDADEDARFDEAMRMFDLALAESEKAAGNEPGDDTEAPLSDFAASETTGQADTGHADDTDGERVPDTADAALPDEEPENEGIPYALADVGDDSPLDPSTVSTPEVEPPEAPDWGLVDFDADEETAADSDDEPAVGEDVADPSAFGIEKVSAADYLAPEGGEGETVSEEIHLSLELETIEEAMAPSIVQHSVHEMTLESDQGRGVRRVVVVGAGASEEARTSLRDFLAALDRVPDALMVAVIHQQGSDDLQMLARELGIVSTAMPVRVAGELERSRHGEIVLVPAGKQAVVERSGRLQLLDATEQPLTNPSIDLTMTLMAQEMGSEVLAVILAGGNIDALAGAQAVNDAGGNVWALDPADCTDNTMVSVLCEEHLVRHTGTPQELAARLLEELS